MRHMFVDLRERFAAVASRILDLPADLSERLGLPCHRLRRDMPKGVSRNARGLIVRALMAGRAAHADSALVVRAAYHQRGMRMSVVALGRPFADGMAIQAARMLKNANRLDEQRA